MTVTYRVVYRIFGIPVWSITKEVNEEELYNKMTERFGAEMKQAFDAARMGR